MFHYINHILLITLIRSASVLNTRQIYPQHYCIITRLICSQQDIEQFGNTHRGSGWCSVFARRVLRPERARPPAGTFDTETSGYCTFMCVCVCVCVWRPAPGPYTTPCRHADVSIVFSSGHPELTHCISVEWI